MGLCLSWSTLVLKIRLNEAWSTKFSGCPRKVDQFQTLSITRFRYTCPIKKKCSMNEGSKPKSMGYKQYAIHAGHEHNMVLLDNKTV